MVKLVSVEAIKRAEIETAKQVFEELEKYFDLEDFWRNEAKKYSEIKAKFLGENK